MKSILITAVVALSLSFATSVFPSNGGGGRGHGGGGHAGGVSGHVSGGRSYSGGHGYSGSRGYYSAGRNYHSTTTAGRFPVYGPRLSNRSGNNVQRPAANTPRQQQLTSRHPAGQNINRSQVAPRDNRISGSNQIRGSRVDRSFGQKTGAIDRRNLVTRDGNVHKGNWARRNPATNNRLDQQTQQRLRNWQGRTAQVNEAQRRHFENTGHNPGEGHHGHHGGDGHHHRNHDWWHNHCDVIVLAGWGYWGWWDGWWFPAWGYDPYYEYYPYDGPIYGYGGLAPDEVVANVQSELQRLGYYTYAVDGIMGPLTQEAINRYQRDSLLPITGTIDPATVSSLGLS